MSDPTEDIPSDDGETPSEDVQEQRQRTFSEVPPLAPRPNLEEQGDSPGTLYRDELLTFEEFRSMPTFSKMKTGKFPRLFERRSVILRRYERGEVVLQQGDAGYTAFYLLTDEDLAALRRHQSRVVRAHRTSDESDGPPVVEGQAREHRLDGLTPEERAELRARLVDERRRVRERIVERQRAWRQTGATGESRDERVLATAWLLTESVGSRRRGLRRRVRKLVDWVRTRLRRGEPPLPRSKSSAPRIIQIDSGTAIDRETMRGDISAGEVFGDVSCVHRAPRSATVVANEQCYALEMVRSVYDELLGNKAFRDRQWDTYRRRTLSLQLRRLPPFQALEEKDLAWLTDENEGRVELVTVDSGDVIFEEGQVADGLYIVHNGLVKVVANVRCRLDHEDFSFEVTDESGARRTVVDDGWFERLFKALSELAKSASASIEARRKKKESAEEAERERRRQLTEEAEDRGEKPPSFPPMITTPPIPVSWDERSRELLAEKLRDEFAALAKSDESVTVPSPEELGRGELPSSKDVRAREVVVGALNAFVTAEKGAAFPTRRDPSSGGRWGSAKEITRDVGDPVLDNLFRGISNETRVWSQIEVWLVQRRLLELLLPGVIPSRVTDHDRRRVLEYSRIGDVIGEMAVMDAIAEQAVSKQREPVRKYRNATCVAYDHPDSPDAVTALPDSKSPVYSRVEFVKIGTSALRDLLKRSEAFRDHLTATIAKRRPNSGPTGATSEKEGRPADNEAAAGSRQALKQTVRIEEQNEVESLGLVQGQSLMLIDLDSCTRCNACVEACVKSHDDRRTRLYLDGPRWLGYLLPVTCRSCLDPVCMIGCPVGSINKGDAEQIVIEPWCIGCDKCANQCPYGSIKMEDLRERDLRRIEQNAREMYEMYGEDFRDVAYAPSGAEDSHGDSGDDAATQAVVCDLCASAGHGPACVSACPHESALRVSALDELQDVYDGRWQDAR